MHTLIICRQHQITKMTYSAGGTGVLKNLVPAGLGGTTPALE